MSILPTIPLRHGQAGRGSAAVFTMAHNTLLTVRIWHVLMEHMPPLPSLTRTTVIALEKAIITRKQIATPVISPPEVLPLSHQHVGIYNNRMDTVLSQQKYTQQVQTAKKRVAFQTIGCKLNQFESDSLATQFRDAGYELVDIDQSADAYIINTCTVTHKADRKSRNLMYQAQRASKRYGNALVVVTGCFAEHHHEEIVAHDNTYAVGNKKKHAIFQIVEAHCRGEILNLNTVADDVFLFQPARPHYRTRGTLKIQDGCDNYCTFCIIPFVRGKATSRPWKAILQDMRTYIEMGYREVVLTGVNISRYQHEEMNFSGLLEQLLALPTEDFRLRISSLEPDTLDDRFFDLLHHPRMTPHLHLCLQSGSERILLQMRRQYTVAQYQSIVDRIRMQNPHFNITTDIIVGFPAETEQDFADSRSIIARNSFGHVHIFPYAVRAGTRAARMTEQHDARTIAARCKVLKRDSDKAKRSYRQSVATLTHTLLTESELKLQTNPIADATSSSAPHTTMLRGYSQYYVPIQVPRQQKNGDELALNRFYQTKIERVSSDEEPILYANVCAS